MRANIVGKQRNDFGCDAVSGDEVCEITEKSDVSLRAYISTSKPEFFFFSFF